MKRNILTFTLTKRLIVAQVFDNSNQGRTERRVWGCDPLL